MKKYSLWGAYAILLACAFALPLLADEAYRPASDSSSTANAAAVQVDPIPTTGLRTSPKTDPEDKALRSEYRQFARRLREVDRLISKAGKNGSFTAEEAVQHHADVALIRVQFKLAADKSALAMSPSEKAKMEYEVKVQEKSARDLD